MGCELSTRFPKLCKRDEALFEELLRQCCDKNKNGITSQTNVENYGLVSFSELEERVDKNGEPDCSVHWTDYLEIAIITFIVILVGRFLWGKLQTFRQKKRIKKLEGMRVLYRQAMIANDSLAQPSAPVTIPIQQNLPVSPRVTPYTPLQEELDRAK